MSCRPPKWGIYVQTCTQTNTSYLPVSAVASVALCAFPISFSQGSRSAAPSGSCYTNEIHRRSSEEAPTLCPRRYLHLFIDVTGLWPSQPHRSDAALVKHFSTILCNTFSFHQMPLQSVLWVLLLFQLYLLIPLQMKSSEEALLMPQSQSEHLLMGLLEKLEHVWQKMDLLVLLMLQNR